MDLSAYVGGELILQQLICFLAPNQMRNKERRETYSSSGGYSGSSRRDNQDDNYRFVQFEDNALHACRAFLCWL